jgi:hypothetical protein
MRKLYPIRIIVTIIAIITSLATIIGLIYYISPTTTFKLISYLPDSWQETIVMDFIFRGGTGFWIFLCVSVVLWWIIPRIRF